YRTNRAPACGSCRTCGRTERVHRSLEKRTERAFPQLPHALSSFSKGTRALTAASTAPSCQARWPSRRWRVGCTADPDPSHAPLPTSLICRHLHAQNAVYVVVHTPRRSAAHGHATRACRRHASRGVNDPHGTGAGPPRAREAGVVHTTACSP